MKNKKIEEYEKIIKDQRSEILHLKSLLRGENIRRPLEIIKVNQHGDFSSLTKLLKERLGYLGVTKTIKLLSTEIEKDRKSELGEYFKNNIEDETIIELFKSEQLIKSFKQLMLDQDIFRKYIQLQEKESYEIFKDITYKDSSINKKLVNNLLKEEDIIPFVKKANKENDMNAIEKITKMTNNKMNSVIPRHSQYLFKKTNTIMGSIAAVSILFTMLSFFCFIVAGMFEQINTTTPFLIFTCFLISTTVSTSALLVNKKLFNRRALKSIKKLELPSTE